MKKVLIAFDVDGTLIQTGYETEHQVPRVNERIRSLLITLSRFKNTKIMVWSGGGELYARQVAREIGIQQYVDKYAGKNLVQPSTNTSGPKFEPDVKPDIAIDDIQDCDLGVLNLIVREK